MTESLQIIRILLAFFVGLLFVLSYFLADKHWFFEWLAYFPRRRKGALKVSGLIFGCVLWLIAIYHYMLLP